MPKISKSVVDAELRAHVLDDLFPDFNDDTGYTKVNDRQYGIILPDKNGVRRYVRVGVIVAEEREDMTADELMQSEINAYNQKQAEKAEKAKEKAAKIERDKARREAKKKEAEEGE